MVNRKGESGHPYLVLLCNVKLCDVSPLVITLATVYIILIQSWFPKDTILLCIYQKWPVYSVEGLFLMRKNLSVLLDQCLLLIKLVWSGLIMRWYCFFFLFCEWVCVVVIVMSTWRTQQESHQCFVVWHELEGSVTYDLCYQWVNHVSLFLTEFGNLMLLSNEWMSAMFSQIEGVVMVWQPTAVKRETTVWDSISTFIGVKTLDILNETLGYWQQYQIVLPRLEDNFQPSLWWQHPWSQNMIFS